MSNWDEMAKGNRTAANRLFGDKLWRACVNRAYYAVYSSATDALLKVPISMPAGREGPHHIPLPQLIGYNLTLLKESRRWTLAGLLKRLYDLRVLADYRPSVDIEEAEARIALGLMNRAFFILESIP